MSNNTPTLADAITLIAKAKARGARVMCSKGCGNEASLLLACPDGTLQGTACSDCWAVHTEFIQFTEILQASEMVDSAFCSRCGEDKVTAAHIVTTEIA